MSSLLPLRVLSVTANPSDYSRFDDDAVWRQFCQTLGPLHEQEKVLYEQLRPASANALRDKLSSAPWNVLHLIARGQDHAAAHYGTLVLESSDGRAGNITGQALAALLSPYSSLALVVIQSPCDGPMGFDAVAEELVRGGVPAVVVAPRLPENLQGTFLARLYAGVLMGITAGQLSGHIAMFPQADGKGPEMVRVLSRDPQAPVFALAELAAVPQSVGPAPPAPAPLLPTHSWREILQEKRRAEAFDVFLCHNSADKPMVRNIGHQLKQAGILPWLDVDELPPGQLWQPLLEKQIKHIRSTAVCFGAAGIGPWQEREMYGFLNAFVRRGAPVIPVLLPDAPSVPDLPVFLAEMTWVDFRCSDPDPLAQLIWGITGVRPEVESLSAISRK